MTRSPRVGLAKLCPGCWGGVGGGRPPLRSRSRRHLPGSVGQCLPRRQEGASEDEPGRRWRLGVKMVLTPLPSGAAKSWEEQGQALSCHTEHRTRRRAGTFLKHVGAASAPSRFAFSPSNSSAPKSNLCGRFAHTTNSQTSAGRPRIQLSPGRVCLDVASDPARPARCPTELPRPHPHPSSVSLTWASDLPAVDRRFWWPPLGP